MTVCCVLVQEGSAQEEVEHTGLSDSSISDQGSSYYVNISAGRFTLSLLCVCSVLELIFLRRVHPEFSQSSFVDSDDLGSDDDISMSTVQNNSPVRLILHL